MVRVEAFTPIAVFHSIFCKYYMARQARDIEYDEVNVMDGKIVYKGVDLPQSEYDELNEFLEDSEYVPMSIPILKQRVWIPVKDALDPQGHRYIPIDEWMPLGSLYRFKNFKWIPIYDDEEYDDWIPFEDMIDVHDDDQDDDDQDDDDSSSS